MTKDQVEDLYNIYRLDFMLFSYKTDIFMNVAKDDNQILDHLENAKLNQISAIDSLNRRVGTLMLDYDLSG
jgi:hypothetical protein